MKKIYEAHTSKANTGKGGTGDNGNKQSSSLQDEGSGDLLHSNVNTEHYPTACFERLGQEMSSCVVCINGESKNKM